MNLGKLYAGVARRPGRSRPGYSGLCLGLVDVVVVAAAAALTA